MCNINNETQVTTTAGEMTPKHKVETMLRDIAFVLRMTRQVKAEMKRERAEAEVEVQRRNTKLEELMAVSM